MMNGMKKIIYLEKPKKRAGPRLQGIVKNQMEIMEVKKNLTLSSQIHSAFFSDCGMSQADIRNNNGLYNQSK